MKNMKMLKSVLAPVRQYYRFEKGIHESNIKQIRKEIGVMRKDLKQHTFDGDKIPKSKWPSFRSDIKKNIDYYNYLISVDNKGIKNANKRLKQLGG